jgi:hypothetical protein
LWCEKIYLNTGFYCGINFIKSKLNTLPKWFGPGPIVLVLSKMIQMLISVSIKPFKTLKLLQASSSRLVTNHSTNIATDPIDKYDYSTTTTTTTVPSTSLLFKIELKAKEKGKYMRKHVLVCTKRSQLPEYLNDLCNKLKICNRTLSLQQMMNNDSTMNTNNNNNNNVFCLEFKCCTPCSINYHQQTPSVIDVNSTVTNDYSNLMFKRVKPKSSLSMRFPSTSTKKTLQQQQHGRLTSIHNRSTINNNINKNKNRQAPVKTRQNDRLSILYTIKQQQQELEEQHRLQQLIEIQEKKEKLKLKRNLTQQQQQQKTEFKNNNKKLKTNNSEPKLTSSNNNNNNTEIIIKKTKKKKKKYENTNQNDDSLSYEIIDNEDNYEDDNFHKDKTTITHNSNKKTHLNKSLPISNGNNKNSHQKQQQQTNSQIVLNNLNQSLPLSIHKNSNSPISTAFSSVNGSSLPNETITSITLNPIQWTTSDVCKYLIENKYDSNLIYLIEEHVTFCV